MKDFQSKLAHVQQTNTKFEKDLEGVHASVHDREMKLEDLNQQLVEKDEVLEKKESKIGDLSGKVKISYYSVVFALSKYFCPLKFIMKYLAKYTIVMCMV